MPSAPQPASSRRVVLGLFLLSVGLAIYACLRYLSAPQAPSPQPPAAPGAAPAPQTAPAMQAWRIERYPDGRLKSRSATSNGVLEGLSEGWYTNGVKQVEERFHAGVSHGVRIKWHENGHKCSEAAIVSGKIEGVFRRWHDNGVLAEEIPMAGSRPTGIARSYYPSGCLKAEASLQDGKPVSQQFWKDGERPASH